MLIYRISILEWLDEVFFPTNFQRMKCSYEYTVNRLSAMKIPVRKTKAAFFIWADFNSILDESSKAGEISKLNTNQLKITPCLASQGRERNLLVSWNLSDEASFFFYIPPNPS